MSRTYNRPDCFQAMVNNRRMTRAEIRGFQQDFNVNLSADQIDDDSYLDDEPEDYADLNVIDDEAFVHAFVMGDDLLG